MQNQKHQSKTVLITGAARRVGAVIARHLHGQGMNVVVHYRSSEEEAHAFCDELNNIRAHSAALLQADLHHTALLPGLISQAHAVWGRLDALINNASSFYPTPIGQTQESEWDELFGSNVKSAFFLMQAAAPLLAEHQGSIINITDVNVYRPLKKHAVYCAAKAGLHLLTQSFALELAPHVRVNAVAPSPVLLPDHASMYLFDSEEQAKFIEKVPLKRIGTPQDVAEAVYYLLNAAYVTGEVIAVDGGVSL